MLKSSKQPKLTKFWKSKIVSSRRAPTLPSDTHTTAPARSLNSAAFRSAPARTPGTHHAPLKSEKSGFFYLELSLYQKRVFAIQRWPYVITPHISYKVVQLAAITCVEEPFVCKLPMGNAESHISASSRFCYRVAQVNAPGLLDPIRAN